MRISSEIKKNTLSLINESFDNLIEFFFVKKIATKIQRAGITIALNIAEPAIVAIPDINPALSLNIKRKITVVNNSGVELAMALIVAPFIPDFMFRPR